MMDEQADSRARGLYAFNDAFGPQSKECSVQEPLAEVMMPQQEEVCSVQDVQVLAEVEQRYCECP